MSSKSTKTSTTTVVTSSKTSSSSGDVKSTDGDKAEKPQPKVGDHVRELMLIMVLPCVVI